MTNKTFIFYCDESCHLENDHKNYMLLSYVSCPYPQVKLHTQQIQSIKEKHHFYSEIKWSNVSSSQYEFYKELIDYFFATDLRFRAIIINKHTIKNGRYQQDFDTFYYKMFYYLLNHNIKSNFSYNVYLDIKDNLSAYKVATLKEILNTKYGVFRNIQNIRSHESLLLQLTDVLMGALSYNLNQNLKVNAKIRLIDRIKYHSQTNLNATNYNKEFNLFFIDLK